MSVYRRRGGGETWRRGEGEQHESELQGGQQLQSGYRIQECRCEDEPVYTLQQYKDTRAYQSSLILFGVQQSMVPLRFGWVRLRLPPLHAPYSLHQL